MTDVDTGFCTVLQYKSLQHRLRHLHSIAARNVTIPTKHSAADVSLMQLYFTLHKDLNSAVFYTSEKIKGSLNPVWKSLSLGYLDSCTDVDTTRQSVTVRVWYCYGENESKLCITWDVHFAGLICLTTQNVSEYAWSAQNTLIFGIHEGVYCAASESPMIVTPELAIPSDVRNTYNLRYLQRVDTVLRAIHQTRSIVKHIRQKIDCCLVTQLYIDRKRAQHELAVFKVNLIRNDLQWRIVQLRHRKDALELEQLKNLQKEVSLRKKWSKLTQNSEELRERKKHYFDIRDELIKTGAHLVLRRKQLLSDLALIYPIIQNPNTTDNFICGVRLPHSEDFDGQDEIMLTVSLGYVCHLVAMTSNYLDIPLRYPMDHNGSRSTISDFIIGKLADSERQFPLFGKGKEKFQFHYGVYILNKNIAQLRHYCGMSTPELRCTLENICSLLCDRLGVSLNRNDAFSNQHSQVPPSFGGPYISSTVTQGHHDALSECSETSSTQLIVSQHLDKINGESSSRILNDHIADGDGVDAATNENHHELLTSDDVNLVTLTSECVAMTTQLNTLSSDVSSMIGSSHIEELNNELMNTDALMKHVDSNDDDASQVLCQGRTTFKTYAMTDCPSSFVNTT